MKISWITLSLSICLLFYSFVSSLSLSVPSASPRSLSFRLLSTLDDGTNDIMDDAGPSDYDPRDIFELNESNESESKQVKSLQVDTRDGDAIIREELKRELLLLASVTNRGTLANQEEKDIISDIIAQLEALNPTPEPLHQMIYDNDDMSDYEHEWDLVVTNTQLFRASPFFLLVRSLLKEQSTANDLFDLYNQLTSVNKIGRVREIFHNGVMRSEIDLEVGFMKATVITQASYDSMTKSNANPETMELYITSTNIKQSNVPFMDVFPLLIGSTSSPLELPIGQLLKNIRGNVPKVVLKTFYIDEGLRITRDVDDNFYVFSRV